jgi:peptidylprolyl isomerase
MEKKNEIINVVKKENWVEVDYEGKFDNGEIFDSSKNHGPLTFKVGTGTIIKGFDNAILSLKVGEEKEFKINAKDAYGLKNNKSQKIPKDAFNDTNALKEGKEIMVNSASGPLVLNIIKVNDKDIDATINHPLAGKDLIFKIKLNKILNEKESKDAEKAAKECCGNCEEDDDGCCGCH